MYKAANETQGQDCKPGSGSRPITTSSRASAEGDVKTIEHKLERKPAKAGSKAEEAVEVRQ